MQTSLGTQHKLDGRSRQFISGPFVAATLTPDMVPQLAHAGLAVLRVRHVDQVPVAQHGDAMAEGGGVGVEGSHRSQS